jgi:hypothetical protein
VREMTPAASAPTLELLAWIAERPRGYAETMEAWRSSCPRLTVWEDAVAEGLVRVERGNVLLSAAGAGLLQEARSVTAGGTAGAGASARS